MFTSLSLRRCGLLLVSLVATGLLVSSWARADDVGAYDPLVRVHLARAFDGAATLVVVSTGARDATLWRNGAVRTEGVSRIMPAGATFTVEALAAGTSTQKPGDVIVNGLCSLHDGESLRLSPISGSGDPGVIGIRRDPGKLQHYRGSLLFTAHSNGTLSVVDTLRLDDYLKGVVGPEIGSSAPLEAMKAQAIAARTYAVKNFGKCVQDGGSADLDDTTRCQSYLGYDVENWRSRTAVGETAGKIITYAGLPIDAVYSTDSGGVTAEGAEPYLKPVHDPDCAESPPWMVSLPLSDLSASLSKSGMPSMAMLNNVQVSHRDASARADAVLLTDIYGKRCTITGVQLRKCIGYDRLRSTLFDLKIDSLKNVVFTGRGWGHGLGMCQRGAISMARAGVATCSQIIYHYYSGVEITDLTSDYLQADSDDSRDASSSPGG